jgi:hypothetical protein
MFRTNLVRSALVATAAVAAVSIPHVAGVASAAHPGSTATVTVPNPGPIPLAAETVKKGARITGSDRSTLAGELTRTYSTVL